MVRLKFDDQENSNKTPQLISGSSKVMAVRNQKKTVDVIDLLVTLFPELLSPPDNQKGDVIH